MTTVGAILAGFVLLGAAVAAAPKVWAFVKAVGRSPIVLERMYAEFSPNGGGSLRDAVDRVEDKVHSILEWQDDHSADDTVQFTQVRENASATDAYVHQRMHDVLNELTKINLRLHNMEKAAADEASGPG